MADQHPTAIVSWAHTSVRWSEEQAGLWRQQVMALVDVLRDNGIDADVDLHHAGDVDWTRFGPQAIVEKDWVLVALSPSWKERWEGTNDPKVGAGAAGEANALRSIWVEDQRAFRKKLVLLILPMMRGEKLIPLELHGVEQFSIDAFTNDAVEPLLRLLTDQPAYPERPLGQIPRLGPEARIAEESASDEGELPEKPALRSGRHSSFILQSLPPANLLLNNAPRPEGSPDHWSPYDGMLLFRFVARAVPQHSMSLRGAAVPERLATATADTLAWVQEHLRETAEGYLHRMLRLGWRPAGPKRWAAGRSSDSADEIVERPTAGVVMVTEPPALAMDATIPTRVLREGKLRYYAAHEPRIAADLVTLIVLASRVMTESQLLDMAVFISAAPRDADLVSAESYAQYPFDEPHDRISPTGPFVEHSWSEHARAGLGDLDKGPWSAARALLDDWLITFRQRDLLDEIAKPQR